MASGRRRRARRGAPVVSRLHSNCLPADLMVGCTFAERLRTAAEVALNGGTVHGAPVFSGGGMVCDGTNDYIVYALEGHEFYSDEISFECEFWPDFETDEDVSRVITFTTRTQTYGAYKNANVLNNSLGITMGSTNLVNIAEATYSPYWKVNARNVLTVSGKSGNTNAWLNGYQIKTADATAWTKKVPTEMGLGATALGGWPFKGKVGPIKIYKSLLTARDHYNTYHNKAYGFTNDAVLYLPMTAARHEATRTLDVSGNNNHAVFGAGGATPTKGAKRGYNFDGGDYMIAPATGIFNRPEIGIAFEFTPGFPTDENQMRALFYATSTAKYSFYKQSNAAGNVLYLYLGNTAIGSIAEVTYKPYWRQGERNVLAISGESGATDAWLNGGLILDADNTAWTSGNPAEFFIGCHFNLTNKFLGDIHSMMIFPHLLTPRMVADLRHNRRNSIGEV